MNEQTPVKDKGLAPVFRMAVLAGVEASVQLHVRPRRRRERVDDGQGPADPRRFRGRADMQLLLEAGADPAHVDVKGNDALMAATAKGHQAVAEVVGSHRRPRRRLEPVPQPVEAGRPSPCRDPERRRR